MRIRTLVVPLAMLLSLALVAPGATAAVRYKTSKAYFTCTEDMPVQNVSDDVMNLRSSWSKERPRSLYPGGACGYYANLGLHLYVTGT